MKRKIIFVAGLILFASAVQVFAGADCTKKIVLKSVDFPGNNKEEGFWGPIHAASDGKVYIALCTEGGGHAHFYIYDPAKDQMIHRQDLAKFLGGSGKGIRTHAKVHSAIREDKDGNLYFVTGNMTGGPDEIDPTSWEGGHWLKYDTKSDTLTDLGLVTPHAGIYGLAIDKERKRLLGVSRNGHFMVYDIPTGKTYDKGRVNMDASVASRMVVSDDLGNAYGTFEPDRIFKYDAATERVLDLHLRLPTDPTIYPRTVSIIKRYMRAGVWDDVNKKMYGVEGCTSILFEYDPKAGDEGQIKVLDRLLPCQSSEEVRKAHYATLSLTIGKDRKIYYMPIGSLDAKDDERANKGIDFFKWAGQGYLISYDLNTGKKEELGRVYTQDGAMVIDGQMIAPSGAGTTGLDGTIYFCGYVEEKNPEFASRYFGNLPVRLRLLIYKPQQANK